MKEQGKETRFFNTTTGIRAIKNLSSLLVAKLVATGIGFIAVAFIARKLTPVNFGRLAFAQALFAYFALIGNFGLNLFGIREVARDREGIRKTVDGVITLQTLLSILGALLLTLVALSLPRPAEDKILIAVFGINIILTGIFLDWVFKGLERMVIVAVATIVQSLVYAGLVFLLVRGPLDILKVPINLIISMVIMVSVPAVLYIRSYGWPRPSFDFDFWKYALRVGIPFFFSIVFIQIYYNLDTIMLDFMKTNETVGLYNAAYKIILAIIGLGLLLQETLFPLYARFHKESNEKLAAILNIAEKIYMTIAIPLALGGTLLAKPIIELVYGKSYGGATVAFQVLIWTVAVIFTCGTFGVALMACNQEKKYMIGVGLGALINIVLNFVLIPPFGMVGAASATVAAEITVGVYMIVNSRQIVSIRLGKYVLRPAIASIVMGIVIYFTHVHVLLKIVIGTFVYAIALLMIKGIGREDISSFKLYVLGRK